MRRVGLLSSGFAVLLLASLGTAQAAEEENGNRQGLDPAGIARLRQNTGGKARVSISPATGAARFVRFAPGERGDLMATASGSARQKSAAFIREYAGIFGLRGAEAELQVSEERSDELGGRHVGYAQSYRGVPVFAGMLRAHFNREGELTAVNGNVIPEISVNPDPSRTAAEAAAAALAAVGADNPGRDVYAQSGLLLIYRTGLAQGIDGENHLTWQVEVGNGSDIREFVYVDAHSGKVVDRLPGIIDAMFRRAYDGLFLTTVPPSYPGSPFWVEGDSLPTSQYPEADNMIIASKETYDFYKNAFGRDSFDGLGGIMDSIFNRGYSCPNASWNGTFISFCNGLTTDDVTGHEWTHAYTQYTHGLIYAWQPGALNESYSDIFGETIDKINGRGTDTPDIQRLADNCSTFGGTPPPTLTITGGSAEGDYQSRPSVNEPPRPFTVGPTAMALSVPASACSTVTGVSGKIAIIDFTLNPDGTSECGSGARANNARLAGATGIIFVAPASGILNLGASALIASVEVTNADGALIKAGLPASATISLGVGTDTSVRWLLGEDDTAVGLAGPLRDMWNPRCFGNPGKVSDTFEYACSTADGGGVHTNSGVPNHAYSLIVDGGTYNGFTINGIGLIKAAHVYFQAMSVHQNPATDFADHADAIEQSASDLLGVNLTNLTDGALSGQTITAADIVEIQNAMLAVEMRKPPLQCNFHPILAQNPPDRCEAGTQVTLFFDDFQSGSDGWTLSHDAVVKKDFTSRDWALDSSLPGIPPRAGTAFFADDSGIGTCAPGGDESGVLHLDSPLIILPGNASNPLLTFDHYVATEAGFDGGNLKIRVNGGPYTLVAKGAYTFNPYNTSLTVAGNTNPMAGQQAFSGTDGGEVFSTWGRSHVDLSGYAGPNDKISLRWDFGTDGCGGNDGWYVDDVTVYACLPALSINDVSVVEGNSGKKSATFTVTLSPASASAVTVQYKSADGTATEKANDYVGTGVKTLTIPAGATSGTISVDVKGDTLVEPNEVFFVNLSNPTNATIVDGQGQCTITNDD